MARKVKAARTAAVASGRGAAFKARVALAACKGDKTPAIPGGAEWPGKWGVSEWSFRKVAL